jgi:hypothetical protein
MTESRLPPLAVVLGLAGLIPFIFTGLGAVRSDPISGQVGAMGLISYGAVTLAFLGGVHWGFVLEGAPAPAERSRLSLGVVPALIGWGAVLLGLAAYPAAALVLLIAGFVGTAVIEHRAARRELVPRGYMLMRWGLSAVVVLILTTVLGRRLVGGRLMF